jgi:hypothetical protein
MASAKPGGNGVLREERRNVSEPKEERSGLITATGSVILTYAGCQRADCPRPLQIRQDDNGVLPTQADAISELPPGGSPDTANFQATEALVAAGHHALAVKVEAIMARPAEQQ